jgi:transcription antitermination factor NusG
MTTPISECIWRMFEPGTPVIVDHGPLEGVHGTVLGVDEDQQLIVTIALRRGVIPVAIDPTQVRIGDRLNVVPFVTH